MVFDYGWQNCFSRLAFSQDISESQMSKLNIFLHIKDNFLFYTEQDFMPNNYRFNVLKLRSVADTLSLKLVLTSIMLSPILICFNLAITLQGRTIKFVHSATQSSWFQLNFSKIISLFHIWGISMTYWTNIQAWDSQK